MNPNLARQGTTGLVGASPELGLRPARYDLAMRLGPAPKLSPEEELANRIRLVLETQTGQMPWAPQFGCDLAGLTDRPALTAVVTDAQARVATALKQWLPNVTLSDIRAEVLSTPGAGAARPSGVPLAEAALGSKDLGVHLALFFIVETESGPLEIEAVL